jgi:hypothetical protein
MIDLKSAEKRLTMAKTNLEEARASLLDRHSDLDRHALMRNVDEALSAICRHESDILHDLLPEESKGPSMIQATDVFDLAWGRYEVDITYHPNSDNIYLDHVVDLETGEPWPGMLKSEAASIRGEFRKRLLRGDYE